MRLKECASADEVSEFEREKGSECEIASEREEVRWKMVKRVRNCKVHDRFSRKGKVKAR
jgi:hypothetical protein